MAAQRVLRALLAPLLALSLGLGAAPARAAPGGADQALEAWLFEVARRTYGLPYRYGGEDPRTGIDCSAYVRWVYRALGISLPRTSRQQLAATVPVREYRPGYLLFFSENGRYVTHVGIYAGRGYMLHASGRWGKVVLEPVNRYASILVAIGAPRPLLRR